MWRVSTMAGSKVYGYKDGPALQALFDLCQGITVDKDHNLYVADIYNRLIRKISRDGTVSTLAGNTQDGPYDVKDGRGNEASFSSEIYGITMSGSGSLLVTDTHRIRRITLDGQVTTITTFAATGSPCDGIVETQGRIVITYNFYGDIGVIHSNGTVSVLAGQRRNSGSGDGKGEEALFNYPKGLTADTDGNIFVADKNNHTIRKITPDGQVSTLAGTPGVKGFRDGLSSHALFAYPRDVAITPDGTLIVTDKANYAIRIVFKDGRVTTLAGGVKGYNDGVASDAQFLYPYGVCVDSGGTIYVTDMHRVRKIFFQVWRPLCHSLFPSRVKQEVKMVMLMAQRKSGLMHRVAKDILLLFCHFIATTL